jgi:hypothetical protein
MAGISQEVSPDEVLPLLARNVSVRGYTQSRPDKPGKATEFLVLLRRYLDQARDLQKLTGADGVIRVADCADAEPLLRAMGYKFGHPCGPATELATDDPERAFLTIDSGFPLVDLEEALRAHTPFSYDYAPSRVPVLFSARAWMISEKSEKGENQKSDQKDVVDALLSDPDLARVYWALSRTDTSTATQIYQAVGLRALLNSATVVDFYGSHIYIRSGRVMVPGGAPAERAWASLVGAKPENPSAFVERLLTRDRGWLAAYYDALASANREQQAYLTEPQRLDRDYKALLQPGMGRGAARSAFRPNPSLVLLATGLSLDADGQPHVAGGVAAWSEVLKSSKSDEGVVHEWARKAGDWKNSAQVLEGMFALSRDGSTSSPLNLYLQLNNVDRRRPAGARLSPETVRLLGEQYSRFGDQYRIFAEFPLSDASIAHFFTSAQVIDRISNHNLRANAVGIFQADVGLWQIFARQGQLPASQLDQTWQATVARFANLKSAADVFDAGRTAFSGLIRSATGKPIFNEGDVVALLGGPRPQSADEESVHRLMENRVRVVMDDQRLVSLDTLFALADGLNEIAQGKSSNADMMKQLVSEIREFEMPRPIFTETEKYEWSSGRIDNAHIALQARTDLMKAIDTSRSGAAAEARGELAPFLRDTLVGLNYAYFEPPGDQVLHNNPLFVRSHDFSGDLMLDGLQSWQTPRVFGLGEPAGGGGHLAGSLADLPYVLAQSDENFIVPVHVQALVWDEMVPTLLLNGSLAHWWGISQHELHAAALYQRSGEEILAKAATDESTREHAIDILSDRVPPQRLGGIEHSLMAGKPDGALAVVSPADTFYLASRFRAKFPEAPVAGAASAELQSLASCCASEISVDRVAHDFGAPHPVLGNSYSIDLLNVKSLVSFMGFPSRLLAESWESNNLYWARLADEKGLPAVMLNQVAPQLTLRMAQRIFATDVEDWLAVLRAMRETGEEFREGRLPAPNAAARPASSPASGPAPLQEPHGDN